MAINKTKTLLRIPDDYKIAIVPASDTGAIEMALWSLLGARGVDVLAFDVFGREWVRDIVEQLKLENVSVFDAEHGALPDLASVNFDHDVVFTWNGTTSGVCLPNADWISAAREGLTICDATSALFACPLDWQKLDVTTFSWQKVLGGEAQHGMLILSPRAVERINAYDPPWPLPKLFRFKKNGRFDAKLFEGLTINTPSLLCVEDYLDALAWAQEIGGLDVLVRRADQNSAVLYDWVEQTGWVDTVAEKKETRSTTSVCLKITDPEVCALSVEDQWAFVRQIGACLEAEKAAFDIVAHGFTEPGLRIWTGASVERSDLQMVLPWLEWGFQYTKELTLRP